LSSTNAETPEVWTIESLLQWTQKFFTEKGILSARLDAELLLAHALNTSRIDLYLRKEQPLTEEERTPFRELVRERASGCPVAYLIGTQEFWSLPLHVRPGVLIPRPDTETLVECTLKRIRHWMQAHPGQVCRVAEWGTGSGAIVLALASEVEALEIHSAEISPEAHAVALHNLEALQAQLKTPAAQIRLSLGDALEQLPREAPYDFLIANPPYIPTQVVPTLQPEVARFEPRIALDGGEDGLEVYRQILEHASGWLASEAELLLEIGNDQEDALSTLARRFPAWELAAVHPDLARHPRVVHFRKTAEPPLESS
jgi:release factor glutamine methyltransferase